MGGSGLADDRHCLALLDGIGHPVDGAHNSRTGPELGVQILDLQERCQDPSRCSPSSYSFYQLSETVLGDDPAVSVQFRPYFASIRCKPAAKQSAEPVKV